MTMLRRLLFAIVALDVLFTIGTAVMAQKLKQTADRLQIASVVAGSIAAVIGAAAFVRRVRRAPAA